MKTKFTIFYLLLSTLCYSQTEFINQEFGESGFSCINVPGETRQMGDLLKHNNEYYGVTSFINHTLVKLSSTGDLVTSFGNNGVVDLETGVLSGGIGWRNSYIRLSPDNNLLIAVDRPSFTDQPLIIKRNLDGQLIESFGDNGVVTPPVTDNLSLSAVDIVNNDIVLTGVGESENGRYLFVYKYDVNGNPVSTFGNNGAVTVALEPNVVIRGAQYLPDTGHVVVLGMYSNTPQYHHFIAKYNMVNGTFDSTFGSNGFVNYHYTENNIFPHAIYAEGNSIFLAGSIDYQEGNSDYDLFLKKLDMEGELITTFGNQGTFLYNIAESLYQQVNAINIEDGLITLTGIFDDNPMNGEKIYLLQATSEGLLNTSFGNNGIIKTPTLAGALFAYKTIIEPENFFTVATLSHACSTGTEPRPTVIQFSGAALSTDSFETEGITFYPNPVKDRLYLNSDLGMEKAEVYDATGKLVLTLKTIAQNSLDLSALEGGFYIIQMYSQGKQDAIKILKE